jgi:ribosome-binding protein aMBF1 (putative translation factor)
MNCSRCNRELSENQSYLYQGKIFCEDCLMDIGLSTKECDPWSTYTDTSTRKRHGETGAAGMTEIQAKIYEFVKSKGKATRQEVRKSLGLSEADLQAQLIPLMHSELLKEHSESGEMYLIPIG